MVLRSLPRWRAIAVIVQPWRRNACTSMSSSRVSMSGRNSLELDGGQRPPASRELRLFSAEPRGWGISVSRSGYFQMSAIRAVAPDEPVWVPSGWRLADSHPRLRGSGGAGRQFEDDVQDWLVAERRRVELQVCDVFTLGGVGEPDRGVRRLGILHGGVGRGDGGECDTHRARRPAQVVGGRRIDRGDGL